MAIDPQIVAASTSTGPAADRMTVDDQRDLVCGANRLSVADAAEGLSELEHGLRNILALAKRWHLAADSRSVAGKGSNSDW